MKPKKEKRRELHFVCPECGSKDMLCATWESWVEVEHIYEEGGYDGCTFQSDITTFSCGDCGYELTNERGNKAYQEDLAEWVIKNCPQTDEA
jgi:hypothetical protein